MDMVDVELRTKLINKMFVRNQAWTDEIKALVKSDAPTELLRVLITNPAAKWVLEYYLRILRNA